tara:strand:- start:85 stop:1014 length:930 start_codon:yes stop_codon:yes gene_type:complete
MKNRMTPSKTQICLVGDGKDLSGIALCLGNSGHKVSLIANEIPKTALSKDLEAHAMVNIEPDWTALQTASIIIVNTSENIELKKDFLNKIAQNATKDTLIAINMESYPLENFQEGFSNPERLIGLNWVYPAHQTFFLELIITDITNTEAVEELMKLAREQWGKDPYLLKNGKGIRSRLLAAMARESFYLIDKGYVDPIDIDRACRNDPGYYLPFAGNFRYMDLMGTFIYGLVMKDLNPELSQKKSPSMLMDSKLNAGKTGLESGEGFYSYSENEVETFEKDFLKFNKKIKALMEKYPFEDQNDKQQNTP